MDVRHWLRKLHHVNVEITERDAMKAELGVVCDDNISMGLMRHKASILRRIKRAFPRHEHVRLNKRIGRLNDKIDELQTEYITNPTNRLERRIRKARNRRNQYAILRSRIDI